MAEEGEDKMIVVAGEEADGGWGGGGGGGQFVLPPGYRFAPSEDELVMYYLLPKLQGREHVPNEAIIVADVYQCHPDQLIRKYRDLGQGKSWYFLSPRERKYKDGDRPRRDTKDGCGRWKASTGKKKKEGESTDDIDNGQPNSSPWEEQKVADDGTTIYCESVLAYFEGPRGRQGKSKWLMQELTIPEYEIKIPKKGGTGGKTLDRYVVCKIYLTPSYRDKWNDDEEAGPSSAAPQPTPVENGDGRAVELPKQSKKKAGKRPAEDQRLQNAVAAGKKRARHSNRVRLGAPAPAAPPPPQNNGVQAPFGTPEYYGQPMGYRARAPVPRPSAAFNGQLVHVPRQPAAYDGWVPAMTRRMVGYNGQMQQQQQEQAMAFMMHQQQYHPQPPYSVYHGHQAGAMAMAPRFSLDGFYASEAAQQYEQSWAVLPATSGSASAGEAVTAMAEGSPPPVSTVVPLEGNNGDCGNHDREESAVVEVSPGEPSASAQ